MIVSAHQLPSPVVAAVRGPALAFLRFHYRLAHLPLHAAERVVLCRLDERASTRLACEQLLVVCDRLAARLLDDVAAARRADDLDRHTTLVRTGLARESHQRQRRGVQLLDEQRERFQRRHRTRNSPGTPR
ncbi:hypothetical protein [Rhodococcus opacus]|uniref:hypothetical protein n=1 Tax=Rhodococcus opacus TaxID=37919 RepID=UPI00155A9D33|nr:hypothetical protein [Rhodococcus opacus]